MRLLFVGDLHHRKKDRDALLCSRAIEFYTRIRTHADATFLVGDLIDGCEISQDECREDFLAVTEKIRGAHAIIGNHETVYLPDRAFYAKALNVASLSRVIELGALRVILFDTTVDHESYGELTDERMRWLTNAVKSVPGKPAIVIQHQPIHSSDEICTHRHYVRNSGAYRALLKELPEIALIVTGHRHIPTLATLNGAVPQITLGALCHYPFTVGVADLDVTGGTITFRERLLESLFADAGGIESTITHGQRKAVELFPDVWTGRGRLTTELNTTVIPLQR